VLEERDASADEQGPGTAMKPPPSKGIASTAELSAPTAATSWSSDAVQERHVQQ
jgi:hypothetical protein